MDYSETVKKIKSSIAFIVRFNAENKPDGTGSGFVYGKKGIIVTCNHVIKDANSILVKFPNSEFMLAKVAIKDEEHDLALLKFDDDKREPLELENFDSIKEGMPVIFSGYPLSLQDLTTHQGIISAITKDVTGIATYLIDGTVNSGNSGCPLMNIDGKVIGVVNAKRREHSDLLEKVEKMSLGAVSLHGVDLVKIYQAIINNVQLGIGYAVPASYIPEHKDIPNLMDLENKLENLKKINE
jgi:S1-C subfamily serine protease